MAKKQDKKVTEKLDKVYGSGSTTTRESFNEKLAAYRKPAAPSYTMAEIEDVLKNNKYHSPLYKQLKAILKAEGHWKDRSKGGSFKPGNPYRFTGNR